eukprot:5180191-Karenia_brevis.AAC.1
MQGWAMPDAKLQIGFLGAFPNERLPGTIVKPMRKHPRLEPKTSNPKALQARRRTPGPKTSNPKALQARRRTPGQKLRTLAHSREGGKPKTNPSAF